MTAIEWLEDQLKRYYGIDTENISNAFKTAKEIEKQQIIDAYFGGLNGFLKEGRGAEIYYNETF